MFESYPLKFNGFLQISIVISVSTVLFVLVLFPSYLAPPRYLFTVITILLIYLFITLFLFLAISSLNGFYPTLTLFSKQEAILWISLGIFSKMILTPFALIGLFLNFKNSKNFLLLAMIILYSVILVVAAQSSSNRYQIPNMPFISDIQVAWVFLFFYPRMSNTNYTIVK